METKANHVLIGSVILLFLAAGLGFVIWLAKVEIDRRVDLYSIFFEQAVTGLAVGADVRLKGIPVGRVEAIRIDADDPGRVHVSVSLTEGTPVKSDTVASLEFQGITGVAYVQLSGGSAAAPPIQATASGLPAEIPSVASSLQELFTGAPELIQRVIILADNLNQLVNPENRQAINNILRNTDVAVARLSARTPQVEKILQQIDDASLAMTQTLARADQVLQRYEAIADSAEAFSNAGTKLLQDDMPKAMADFQKAASELRALSVSLNDVVQSNDEAIHLFASDGLVQFTKFIAESRYLVATMTRLVERLQAGPAQFLFGDQQGGIAAE